MNKFKTNYKKVTSLLLVIIMLFSCVSFVYPSAFAAGTEYTKDGYTYTVSGSTAKIVAYTISSSGKVTIPSKLNGYTVTTIGEEAFYACTTLTEIIIPNTVTKIEDYAFSFCISLKTCRIPSSVKSIGKDIFSFSTQLSDIYYDDTEAKWKQISINSDNSWVNTVTMHYVENIYNLGEETYSFDNFSFCNSTCSGSGGHCFGMSVTSSGYHIDCLDKSIIGGNDGTPLYSFDRTAVVMDPICHYFKIQGPGAEQDSMVAGGSIDLTDRINTRRDWNECVNYVRNHDHDNEGSLQIGMWYDGGAGGHAVNFLYYSNVDGQDRIYAYDNNFPEVETYYFMGSDGMIYQAPEQTSSVGIIGIDLMDVNSYFALADDFDLRRHIYADKNQITVENATEYNMKTSHEGMSVMFEIPEDVDTVKIVPLVKDATFVYRDKEYTFTETDGVYGTIEISESDDEVPEMNIVNNSDNCSCNCHAGGIKGFFFKLILFFQKIFKTNKTCKCGNSHY